MVGFRHAHARRRAAAHPDAVVYRRLLGLLRRYRLAVGVTLFAMVADHIVVLDAGRVVEQGTHAELLLHPGKYAALYHLQFRESASMAA